MQIYNFLLIYIYWKVNLMTMYRNKKCPMDLLPWVNDCRWNETLLSHEQRQIVDKNMFSSNMLISTIYIIDNYMLWTISVIGHFNPTDWLIIDVTHFWIISPRDKSTIMCMKSSQQCACEAKFWYCTQVISSFVFSNTYFYP